MTVQLYDWNTPQQRQALLNYFIEFGSSGAHIVGYLMNTHFNQLENDYKISCSHPDPFNQEIVVWFFEVPDRNRVFVSTELILDKSEMTAEGFEHAFGEDRSKLSVGYFKSLEMEELYQKSVKVLAEVYMVFKQERKEKFEAGTLFHHVDMIWTPVFYEHSKVTMDAPCFSFVKSAADPIPSIELPKDMKYSILDLEDTLIVQTKNKVLYDFDYVKDCLKLSSAIRSSSTNELIAWTMTHRDFTVGALHVLPDYRRRGLADAVLADVSKTYRDHYQRQLPNIPLEKLYFSSSVERYNTPSYNLFKKSGWTLNGVGITWLICH